MVLTNSIVPMTPDEVAARLARQRAFWLSYPSEAADLRGVVDTMEASYGVASADMWYRIYHDQTLLTREIARWLKAWESLELGRL